MKKEGKMKINKDFFKYIIIETNYALKMALLNNEEEINEYKEIYWTPTQTEWILSDISTMNAIPSAVSIENLIDIIIMVLDSIITYSLFIIITIFGFTVFYCEELNYPPVRVLF